MAFVKLDTKILVSTLWMDPTACKVFITALLMAEPREITEPTRAMQVADLADNGFVIPPGWYGFVPAAGSGIVRLSLVEQSLGMEALERLTAPDNESRTPDHEGRRMARIAGGYLILNFIKYRDRDHSSAERQARFRARKKQTSNASNAVTVTPVTHADADADLQKKAQKQEHTPQASLQPKPDQSRGTRLPDNWQPSPELIEYARTKRPGLNIADQIESFRDYWHAKAGAGARKVDWGLTFKNWIRSAYNQAPKVPQQNGGSRAAGRML